MEVMAIGTATRTRLLPPIKRQKYQEAVLLLFLTHPSRIVPLQVTLALLPLLMSPAHAGEMQSVYKAIWDLACLAEHFKNSS